MEILKSTLIKRIVISILVWAACAPALVIYVGFSIGSVMELGSSIFTGTSTSGAPFFGFLAIFGIAAWLLLAVMNIAWVKQHQLEDDVIPVIGTLCAIIGMLPFGPMAIVALPGVVFAVYLIYWHSK